MPGKSQLHVKVINDHGVHRNLQPVQHARPRSHLSPAERGRSIRLGCVPVTRGSLRFCRDAGTPAGLRHEAKTRATPRSLADGESKATVIGGKPSPEGWPPLPWRAGPRGQPVAEVLTSSRCPEGLPVGLAWRIAGGFAGDGFASSPTLACPPYLRPEICERVCAYVCARLELSGIFHAGHAFPSPQPFPTSPQARRQTCPHRARPPQPRSRLSRRGAAPALQQKARRPAKFLSSLISTVFCVYAHAHCVFSLSSPPPTTTPPQPALPDG